MSSSAEYTIKEMPFRDRKRDEKEHASVDALNINGRFIHPYEAALWAGGILLLSLFDALFTIIQVGNGAAELNPLMNYFLTAGTDVFFLWKMFISAVSLGVLFLFLPRYRRSRLVFGAICSIYSLVICYHLFGFLQ